MDVDPGDSGGDPGDTAARCDLPAKAHCDCDRFDQGGIKVSPEYERTNPPRR